MIMNKANKSVGRAGVRMVIAVAMTLFALNVNAQIGSLYNDSYSPTQTEMQRFEVRPETRMQDMIMENPALIDGTIENRKAYL